MRCPACSYDRSPAGSVVCNLCATPLVATARQQRQPEAPPEDPAVVALRERTRAEAAERMARSDARRARRRREHAIIGLVAVFGFYLLISFPGSLGELLALVLTSAVIGLPMGFIISRAGGGMYRGALIGAAWVATLTVLLQLALGGHPAIIMAILGSLLAGGVPGAIIGTHVAIDR